MTATTTVAVIFSVSTASTVIVVVRVWTNHPKRLRGVHRMLVWGISRTMRAAVHRSSGNMAGFMTVPSGIWIVMSHDRRNM